MKSRRGGNRFLALVGTTAMCVILEAGISSAGFLDSLKGVLSSDSESRSDSTRPTKNEISDGLLDALRVGAEKAVERASASGGFLDNPRIRVPLPKMIQKAGSALRAVGLGDEVDAFETSLNRGAERASKEALPIFLEAIKGLTFQDVERIWKGGDTAATSYLREKTSSPLHAAFEPVVHASVQEVGVTRAYQSLTGSPLAKAVLSSSDFDLDAYVTSKALEGLFTLLADEEKAIRTNPAARTTELLKKIFGG